MKLEEPIRAFHGSSDPAWARAVRQGTASFSRARERRGLTSLAPSLEAVYVTLNSDKAVEYVGDNGVVLDIVVPAGTEVYPDEDCVAEVIAYTYDIKPHWRRDMCTWDVEEVQDDSAMLTEVQRAVEAQLTREELRAFEGQLDELRDRKVDALDVLLPVAQRLALDDDLVARFVQHGAELGVVPPVQILGAWVFSEDVWEEFDGDLDDVPYISRGSAALKARLLR